MPIKVVVSGTGKMGRQVLAAVSAEPDLEPVGVLSHVAGEEYLSLPDGSGLVPFGADPAALFTRTRPDVVVDFTNAEYTPIVAREALEAVVASKLAGGGVVRGHLAKAPARFFDHVEIVEMHHEGKVDSPSGTAITTARKMAQGREEPFHRTATQRETVEGTRGGTVDGVTIHSVRLPGLVAHHAVIFGGPGETLTIRHDSTSRESFMPGVVLAVRDVMGRQELVLGLETLIGIE